MNDQDRERTEGVDMPRFTIGQAIVLVVLVVLNLLLGTLAILAVTGNLSL